VAECTKVILNFVPTSLGYLRKRMRRHTTR